MSTSSSSRAFWWRLGLIGLFLFALEVYGRFYADPAFMSPPSRIFDAFLTRILPEQKILEALMLCVLQIATAYGLSIVCGTITGLLVGATSFSRSAFMPIVLLLFAIPQVSLLPLVILLFIPQTSHNTTLLLVINHCIEIPPVTITLLLVISHCIIIPQQLLIPLLVIVHFIPILLVLIILH